ncbi:hypothetical protein K6L44_12360 [Gluconacetobacter entanii]|uniref:hypothetical protein n=1 Tax=Gluconacetobacter entanii TaxID=108528 RepID=UPI001C931C35|nr:hypothetical protein [Gluconacetobacter entanii]MBY4640761.1 hypothetical protein [Gluconacetobacter entanii]MCW4581212.1 hypothetical protein [Gluconacetobacter entanii]MCW4584472.1 hypothetical protein [Gluconacetobacter entanii]MCW4587864.1 hypothetical protein [Gluconacetobacter entanii]
MTHDFTPVPIKDLIGSLTPLLRASTHNLHSQFRMYFLTVKDYRVAGEHGIARANARHADDRLQNLEDMLMAAWHGPRITRGPIGPEIEAQNYVRLRVGQRS